MTHKFTPPTQDEMDAILRTDLATFIWQVFETTEPADFTPNWHIDHIAHELQQVIDGKERFVVFNVPPGYTKSVSINIAFTAFMMGLSSRNRIISASHSHNVTVNMSNKVKDVLNSDWYRRIFPDLHLKTDVENRQDYYKTTDGGFRRAVTVGMGVTGDGGNVLLIDDPIDAGEASKKSGLALTEVNRWFDGKLYSRLRDKKKGIIILIMQRFNEDDLAGHLLKSKRLKFKHVNIPAIEETVGGKDYDCGSYIYHRPEGELLCPAIEDHEQMEIAKERLGSYEFAAQYQQRPAPMGGGLIKIDQFKRYKAAPDVFERIVQSWDTAIKAGQLNDPSVCTTWGITGNASYLLDVFVKRMEYPELKKAAINMAAIWNPNRILIEDKASGQSLIQELRRTTQLPIIAVNPVLDKITRMSSQTSHIEAGKIYLPTEASWLSAYEHELMLFPNGSHDDQVDSTSQFLQDIVKGDMTARIRVLG